MMNLPEKIAIDPERVPGFLAAVAERPGGLFEQLKEHTVTVSFREPGLRHVLRTRKKILPSVWVEQHRVAPADSSVPGPWRNTTTPYLVGIMDASFFPGVQEIIICAPPQTGKSDVVNNCIGYATDRKPGNVLAVYPDEITGRDNFKDRLIPMYEDSARLSTYLTGYTDDKSSLRLNLRHMKIFAAWANSAARLANKPLPYVVLDEEDKYPPTVGKKETSPAALAKKRTRTFRHMRKIWRMSTPTTEKGPIWVALTKEAEVVFAYWVRCPDCGGTQLMQFKREDGTYGIQWPGGLDADPREVETREQAYYECEHCKSHWTDLKRDMACRMGEWRDKKNGLELFTYLKSRKPRVIGFHYPSWISHFVSMSESAAAFIWSQRTDLVRPEKVELKDFQNAHAAEPWKVYTKEREESKILALRDDRPRGRVPGGNSVAGLVAGVDTQDYGVWYRIMAFGYGGSALLKETWGVKEGYLPKLDENGNSDFDALAKVLWEDEYLDVDGNKYVVNLTVQDSLGHRTAAVIDHCLKYRGRIIPSVGKATMANFFTWSKVEYYPGTTKAVPGGLQRVVVNTKHFKDELARLLEIAPGDPGQWHEHSEFTADYARHMTAEYLNEKDLWECPSGKANHLWDCSCLCLVGHEVLGMKHWPRPPSIEMDRKAANLGVAKSKFIHGEN